MSLGLSLFAVAQAGALGQLSGAAPSLGCPAKSGPGQQVNCLWKTSGGTLKIVGDSRNYDIRLTAFDRTGKTLWQEQKVSLIFGVRVVDGVLVIETNNNGGGAYITSHTALVSPRLENPVWVWGTPIIHRPASHLALFSQESTGRPEEDAGLDLQRVTLRPRIQVIPLHLPNPQRGGCGTAHGGWEEFGQPKFTQRHVYLVRQDDCGQFMTRYDWVTPSSAPVVYPVQSTRP